MKKLHCLVCQAPTDRTCANCLGPHCPSHFHLLTTSCPGCQAQLWALECKHVRRIASIYAFLAGPLTATAIMLGANGVFTYLAVPAALAAIIGVSAVPAGMRPFIRRGLASKRLPPSSQSMLLGASTVCSPQDALIENEYSKRRKNPPRRASKTSVLGSFYKI